MNRYQISINQLADFQKASEAKKRSIIKQQKTPNTFKIAWYQLPKARIRKALERKGDIGPILKGIEELKARKPIKKRQVNDKLVSLEAMQRFILFKIPIILRDTEYDIIKKPISKSVYFDDVEVLVSPDVIVKYTISGQVYLGAMKIHISKGNKFDVKQQKYVATTLWKYLNEVVALEGEVIEPKLCLSIDIFGGGIIDAPNNTKGIIKRIHDICGEIKYLWNIV
tara:strand:- start:56 stop:730 length:675 start_codon:yes stop_codon:yes gene_type:complete